MTSQAQGSEREPTLSFVQHHAPAIRVIVDRHGAAHPRVFGSVARGDARHDSDVDILVDVGSRLSLFGLVRLQDDLAALLDRPVDVVVDDELPRASRTRILGEAIAL